jgi:mRNA-degrading endonuclease YafQ of YafQ-DinJ toxin-antitoxin module
MYYITTNTFKKKYKKKERISQSSIDQTIELLVNNPRYPGLHTHKVRGTGNRTIFEAYVNDSARLTFEYGENTIILRTNCNHQDVLGNP